MLPSQSLVIRKMVLEDINLIATSFRAQGWDGRETVLTQYYREQEAGERVVFVAEVTELVGYVTLKPVATEGPFKDRYPEIVDFNIFERFQKHGYGSLLIASVEERAKEMAAIVTLGVGLHAGYGPAQRLYSKRGYVPDGSGVWYKNEPLKMNALCRNDDELVLYLSKELER
ncbi:GNAT family acetyltransferase [Enterococcus canis]|uniref:GNAT family acetyltransferase n=1 Tax=Enterococcus canis TaxID=214095 RepID=A0A1L8RHE1_9ENTE|nr:GNAT family N-acetyltransferase [Enterococcus canis]OJG19133.1 GNAT family acetyltransferase [Enterococcus canis]